MEIRATCAALVLGLAGCASLAGVARAGLDVAVGAPLPVATGDGQSTLTYRLFLRDVDGTVRPPQPDKGLLVYLGGSGRGSVLRHAPQLAGVLAMGVEVVVAEKRGMGEEGVLDEQAYLEHADKPTRVADALRVVEAHARHLAPSAPLVLVGGSEGGDVAAAVAARSPRVTHLVLIGCGGGWSQERELRVLLRDHAGYLGLRDEVDLDVQLARMRSDPRSLTLWAGHPYRRWTSYLWSPPLDDLLGVEVPVFLVHGDRDGSVPVQSARAVQIAFARVGKGNLTYVELAGVDHALNQADGVSAFPRVEVALIAWFARQGLVSSVEAEQYRAAVRRAHPELEGGERRVGSRPDR